MRVSGEPTAGGQAVPGLTMEQTIPKVTQLCNAAKHTFLIRKAYVSPHRLDCSTGDRLLRVLTVYIGGKSKDLCEQMSAEARAVLESMEASWLEQQAAPVASASPPAGQTSPQGRLPLNQAQPGLASQPGNRLASQAASQQPKQRAAPIRKKKRVAEEGFN